jgi:hypothetical protein
MRFQIFFPSAGKLLTSSWQVVLRHDLLPLVSPLLLSHAGLLANIVGLLDAAERKIPENMVDQSEETLA